MCGICGFLDSDARQAEPEMLERVAAMALAIAHRGPDDAGAWADAPAGLALGHRRLSILDLSPMGHQPMFSHDGRWAMVFNGEVYNFQELRAALEKDFGAIAWRGHSDSEVVLEGLARWGVEACARRLNGMLAIALWDRTERRLHLIRDRLGKKPLYYGWMGGVFLFGSELKTLTAHPAFAGRVDRDALALYLRHNYLPGPYCIYQGLRKLPPGTILSLGAADRGLLPAPRPYWSARHMAEAGQASPLTQDPVEAAARLEELLLDAVKIRMVADVPLGAFLSGGVDSSLIVALMQAQSSQPVRTFTIGFPEAGYDEAPQARAVAAHLGTRHTELYVSWQDALDVVPRLAAMYDEPFADSSQIPTYLVSHMARQHVTVALSGDAGDELFGGYDRYFLADRVWQRAGGLPAPLKALAGGVIRAASPQAWDRLFGACRWLLPSRMHFKHPGDHLHELAQMLGAGTPEAFYRGLVSLWKDPAALVPGTAEPPTALSDPGQWPALPDFRQRMMYLDLVSYLPDDILVKVDRASMAVALEARAPLLDYRVVELAWRLPLGMKMRGDVGKWLPRQVLYKYVPRELIERPKMGFGLPIDAWLKGPMRAWAEELLDEGRLRREGFFDPAPIRRAWAEHQAGGKAWHYYLWPILMFQLWLEEYPGAA
ncbi:MAG: asparagine synthase (glutamine-hydrolyzing) [Desulfarculus sp.]|nr:asparagine synthase (glutamine-hydrolyzing) [Desulfarculus sp.]